MPLGYKVPSKHPSLRIIIIGVILISISIILDNSVLIVIGILLVFVGLFLSVLWEPRRRVVTKRKKSKIGDL